MDKNLLNDATSTDDSPTPGYVLTEISRSTLASYQACTQLIEFLSSKITKNNHNVKYKCLVIIKHVCRTGRPEFKREIARHTEPIKECLQYRGPPDVLRGDEIYKRVRDMAKEALDSIFDSQMPVSTSAVAAANRIQGMGGGYDESQMSNKPAPTVSTRFLQSVNSVVSSLAGESSTETAYSGHPGATGSFNSSVPGSGGGSSGYNAGGYSGGGSGGGYSGGGSSYTTNSNGVSTVTTASGMTGIGNSMPGKEEPSWMQRAAAVSATGLSAVAGTIGTLAATGNKKSIRDEDFGYATNRGPNAYNSTINYPNGQVSGNGFGGVSASTNVWGGPAGSAGSGMNRAPSAGGSSGSGGAALGGIVPEMPLHSSGLGRAGSAAADGTYEKTMIDALCEPSGLKVVPPEENLASFLVAATTLSEDVVGSCLVDLLNSDAWQTRTKALLVISALAKAKGCSQHAQWWVDHAEELSGLVSDSKSSVRTQVAKTMRALKIDTSNLNIASPSTASQKANNNSESPMISLIDDSDFASPLTSPVSNYNNTNNYTSPAPPAVPPAAPAVNMFESPLEDMFSGMAVSSPVSPSSYHSPPPPAPPAPVPFAAPIETSSGFSFMDSSSNSNGMGSVTSLASPPPVPAPTPASNAMDAFDFLNSHSDATLEPLQTYQQPTLQPTQQSQPVCNLSLFDGLSAVSPSHSNGLNFSNNSNNYNNSGGFNLQAMSSPSSSSVQQNNNMNFNNNMGYNNNNNNTGSNFNFMNNNNNNMNFPGNNMPLQGGGGNFNMNPAPSAYPYGNNNINLPHPPPGHHHHAVPYGGPQTSPFSTTRKGMAGPVPTSNLPPTFMGGQAMLNLAAERKIIPSSNDITAGNKVNNNDAFSFITDEVKSSTKKK